MGEGQPLSDADTCRVGMHQAPHADSYEGESWDRAGDGTRYPKNPQRIILIEQPGISAVLADAPQTRHIKLFEDLVSASVDVLRAGTGEVMSGLYVGNGPDRCASSLAMVLGGDAAEASAIWVVTRSSCGGHPRDGEW